MGQGESKEYQREAENPFSAKLSTFEHIVNTIPARPMVLCCSSKKLSRKLLEKLSKPGPEWTDEQGERTKQLVESTGRVSIHFDAKKGNMKTSSDIPRLEYFFQTNQRMRCIALLPGGARIALGVSSVVNVQRAKREGEGPSVITGIRGEATKKRFSKQEMLEQPRDIMIGVEFPVQPSPGGTEEKTIYHFPSQVVFYGKLSQNDLSAGKPPSINKIEFTKEVRGLPFLIKYCYEVGKGGSGYTLTGLHIAGKSSARQVHSATFVTLSDVGEFSSINSTPIGEGVHNRTVHESSGSLPEISVRETFSEWADISDVSTFSDVDGKNKLLLKLLLLVNVREMADNESEPLTREFAMPLQIALKPSVLDIRTLRAPNEWANPSVFENFFAEAQRILAELPG